MKRELKFRAFDQKENKLWHHYNLPDQYLMDLWGNIWDIKAKCPFGTGLGVNVADRFILQQFTGLTDKKGTEIYEGDIVRYGSGPCEEVTYEGGGFSPFAIPHCEVTPEPEDVEVIGNIFENPELINN